MASSKAEAGHSSVPTAELLAAAASNPRLQAAIQAADANGDGALSVVEIVQVITSQAQAETDRKRMRRLAAVLAALLLLMLAANAGLTYAVVALASDTSTGSDGVMVVKGSESQIVQTATYTETAADWQRLLYATPANASMVQSVSVPTPTGGFAHFQVAGAEVEPGQRVVLHSPWGARLTITPAGMAELEEAPACQGAGSGAAAGRRRLLAAAANGIQTVLTPTVTTPMTGGTTPYVPGGAGVGGAGVGGVSTGVAGIGGVTGSVGGAGVGGAGVGGAGVGGATVGALETPLDKAMNKGLESLLPGEIAQVPADGLSWLLSARCGDLAKLSVAQLRALTLPQIVVLPASCLTPAASGAAAAGNVCGATPLQQVLRGGSAGWSAAQRAKLPAATLSAVLAGWAANPNVLANLFYDNCVVPKSKNAPTNPLLPAGGSCATCGPDDCRARAWLVRGASAAQIQAHVPVSLKGCFTAANSPYWTALNAEQRKALEGISGWGVTSTGKAVSTAVGPAVLPVGQPAKTG